MKKIEGRINGINKVIKTLGVFITEPVTYILSKSLERGLVHFILK